VSVRARGAAAELVADLLGESGPASAEQRMLEALLAEIDPDVDDPLDPTDAELDANVPDPPLPPYAELFDRAYDDNGVRVRARVMYGGRGGAKSWSIARKLLVLGARRKLRILCTREVQATIADSSHKLLKDQIAELGLIRYKVTDTKIRHPNGTEFIFRGLRDPEAIKSAEGVDIVWIEEAQRVSYRSLRALIPTIRKPGSEIWISFNPDQETDPIWVRYVAKPPPGTIVRKVGWQDNPWFHETELELERVYDYETDPEAAAWIWGGELRVGTEAQIFRGKWRTESFEVPRVSDISTQEERALWAGPYYGCDFGFSADPFAAVELWIDTVARVLYVRREVWKLALEVPDIGAYVRERMPGAELYPVAADQSRPDSISQIRKQKHDGLPMIYGADKGPNSVEEGIRFLRGFRAIVIHTDCKHAEQEFRLYSYKVDPLTNEVTRVIVDKWNHLIDSIRYALSKMIKTKSSVRVYIPGMPDPAGEEDVA
jgi:phage terminase large subunit